MNGFQLTFVVLCFLAIVGGAIQDIRRKLLRLLVVVPTEHDQNRLNTLITSSVILGFAIAGLIGVLLWNASLP